MGLIPTGQMFQPNLEAATRIEVAASLSTKPEEGGQIGCNYTFSILGKASPTIEYLVLSIKDKIVSCFRKDEIVL